ncbi:ligand-binding sensor domain-containing protein [Terrimonas sp.]|uniref:ligand-binding sensor domain-containing protein n=1 Tax=Terrimonas sp. TaxID=1914338 RepID=UPI001402FA6B|nr:ATP-binding protein [Terrimonas sp.]
MHYWSRYSWLNLLVFCCILLTQAHAQPQFRQYRIVHYNDETGLPSNDVTGFVEDTNGYFWLSTQFGVVKFDGNNFRMYNTTNLPTLSSNRIFAIGRDVAGAIFLADENGVVHSIDSSGKMTHKPEFVARKNFLLSKYGYVLDIRAQVKNKKDSLYYVSPLTLHAENRTLAHEFFSIDQDKAYFIITNVLKYWDSGKLMVLDSIPNQTLRHFTINKKLYTITLQGDIRVYEQGRRLPLTYAIAGLLSANGDYTSFDIKQSDVFSNATGSFMKYKNRIYSFRESAGALSLSLCVDDVKLPTAQGIYYSDHYKMYIVRSVTDGFYLIKEKPFIARVGQNTTALENNFGAAVEIRDQTIFTANGIEFTPRGANTIFFDYAIINTLLKDHMGRIWYGRLDSLICVDSDLHKIQSFNLPDTYLTEIAEDPKGQIWCITNNSLMKLEPEGLRFIYKKKQKLSRTEAICFINDTTAWIGTNRGLFVCDLRTGDDEEIEEMKEKYIRNFHRSKDGKIWIGTYGDGFYCYNGSKFYQLPLDRKGYLSSSHCFMEDGRGFMWIPTNKGLFQVLTAELNAYMEGKTTEVYYHYYDKNDGFFTNEFNGGFHPVGLQLSDGRFSLPSMNGLVIFDPAKINPELPTGDLRIEKIKVDTVEIDLDETLSFNAGSQNFRFEISTPYFGNLTNMMTEYRVNDYEALWKPVSPDGVIEINYLPPGKYSLDLRMKSGFGVNKYKTLSRSFSIAPFFYQTTWFWVAVGLAFIAMVYGESRSRVMRLEARKTMLEELVQTRTNELKQSVNKLQTTIEELRTSEENLHKSNLLKDKLTSIVLHDIRSPVRFINLLSNHLQQALPKGNQEQLSLLADELKKTTGHLNTFTKEFLVWLSAQQSGFVVRKEYISITELFDEMKSFFHNILEWNNNKLLLEMDKKTGVWTDRQLLKIILHNLVDNSNKHTEHGSIILSASAKGKDIIITVTDTGKGISAEILAELQKGLNEGNTDFFGFTNNSFGYRIIRDFAKRLDAKIFIESEKNKGTKVRIHLNDLQE